MIRTDMILDKPEWNEQPTNAPPRPKSKKKTKKKKEKPNPRNIENIANLASKDQWHAQYNLEDCSL